MTWSLGESVLEEKATKHGPCVLSLIFQSGFLNLGISLVKKQCLFIFNVGGFSVILVGKTL